MVIGALHLIAIQVSVEKGWQSAVLFSCGCALVESIFVRYIVGFTQWIAKKKTEHFEKILRKRGSIGIFLGRILLVFPADVVSFAAGIAEIKPKKFITATTLGVLPVILIITFLGTAIISYLSNKWVLAIVGVVFITILITHKFHHKIAKRIHHKNT